MMIVRLVLCIFGKGVKLSIPLLFPCNIACFMYQKTLLSVPSQVAIKKAYANRKNFAGLGKRGSRC